MPAGLALLIWTCITAAWIATTRQFHPNLTVATCATASLIACYAAAAWINEVKLLPRAGENAARYWGSLIATMLIFTAVALTAIHIAYRMLGPFPTGPAVQHYLIDLFGMILHVAGARAAVAAFTRHNQQGPSSSRQQADRTSGR